MNIDKIKQGHDIVTTISGFLPLKKSGANYVACCPFHQEKTPSFTVSETKQFYHCFGCGAKGDIVDFIVNYSGYTFVDALKYLGASDDDLKSDLTQAGKPQARLYLPQYDKRDPQKAREIMALTDDEKVFFEPIECLLTGELVNAYDVSNNNFVAGGISYYGGVKLKADDSNHYFVCVDFYQGFALKKATGKNVIVVFDDYNMQLICSNKDLPIKTIPLITQADTQAFLLTNKKVWLYADNYSSVSFKKQFAGVDIDSLGGEV